MTHTPADALMFAEKFKYSCWDNVRQIKNGAKILRFPVDYILLHSQSPNG